MAAATVSLPKRQISLGGPSGFSTAMADAFRSGGSQGLMIKPCAQSNTGLFGVTALHHQSNYVATLDVKFSNEQQRCTLYLGAFATPPEAALAVSKKAAEFASLGIDVDY